MNQPWLDGAHHHKVPVSDLDDAVPTRADLPA
ncbi:hypothetical protein FHS40_006373 [Streptomyces spectabilis]|uniref:Uncharacterized protein n=1 Tax=Streptomyces spectabilis TaxID=68270 RepID=A0A7W8B0A6_STRST|nr:hypothetical protein [Streptomyces spectabilis]